MELHNHIYQSIAFNKEKSLLKIQWKSETENMSNKEFKEQSLTYLEVAKKYKPQLCYFNLVNLNFPISPELQEWFDKEITFHEKSIFKKQAIYMPAEFITELSIEQLVGEENSSEMDIDFFDNEEDALKWLLS